MEEEWIELSDDTPTEYMRVQIKMPPVAYIGNDGFWHESITGMKIPSHLVTGWRPLTQK